MGSGVADSGRRGRGSHSPWRDSGQGRGDGASEWVEALTSIPKGRARGARGVRRPLPPALWLGVAKGPPRLLSAVRRAGARSLVSCALAVGTGRDRARSAGSVDRVSGRCMLSAETLVKQRSVGHRWIITSTLATKRSLRGPVSSFPGFQSVTGFELSCGQLGVGGCVAERTLVPSRSRLTGGQALPLMDVLLNGTRAPAPRRPQAPAPRRPQAPAPVFDRGQSHRAGQAGSGPRPLGASAGLRPQSLA